MTKTSCPWYSIIRVPTCTSNGKLWPFTCTDISDRYVQWKWNNTTAIAFEGLNVAACTTHEIHLTPGTSSCQRSNQTFHGGIIVGSCREAQKVTTRDVLVSKIANDLTTTIHRRKQATRIAKTCGDVVGVWRFTCQKMVSLPWNNIA